MSMYLTALCRSCHKNLVEIWKFHTRILDNKSFYSTWTLISSHKAAINMKKLHVQNNVSQLYIHASILSCCNKNGNQWDPIMHSYDLISQLNSSNNGRHAVIDNKEEVFLCVFRKMWKRDCKLNIRNDVLLFPGMLFHNI